MKKLFVYSIVLCAVRLYSMESDIYQKKKEIAGFFFTNDCKNPWDRYQKGTIKVVQKEQGENGFVSLTIQHYSDGKIHEYDIQTLLKEENAPYGLSQDGSFLWTMYNEKPQKVLDIFDNKGEFIKFFIFSNPVIPLAVAPRRNFVVLRKPNKEFLFFHNDNGQEMVLAQKDAIAAIFNTVEMNIAVKFQDNSVKIFYIDEHNNLKELSGDFQDFLSR